MNAILLIGVLSAIAPFFGRSALVWLVDAGGLGIVAAYVLVAVSFLVLRRREPGMPRPYRVRYGEFVGWAAVILGGALALLYMPGFPSALIWPAEWIMVGLWALAGAVFWTLSRRENGYATQDRILRDEVDEISRGAPAMT